jgi:hypothetical protein
LIFDGAGSVLWRFPVDLIHSVVMRGPEPAHPSSLQNQCEEDEPAGDGGGWTPYDEVTLE